MLATIAQILAIRATGDKASDDDIQAALTKRERLPQPTGGKAVAVLPVHGVLIPRANLMSQLSGATSLDALTSDLRDAVADDQVGTIVLDIDSPGGSVAGVTELAREILKARTKKPIVAVAQYTMASAAYWLAAAATEIVASPSSFVGSVGVYNIHDDLSKALEALGVKRTVIAAGKHKVEGHPAFPLTEEAHASMKQRVDECYTRFVTDISKGRGVPLDQVRNGYGEGRTVSADEALRLGMVDKIGTLDETIARVATVAPSRTAHAATDPTPPLADTSQEPTQATDQDRDADQVWKSRVERELLVVQL